MKVIGIVGHPASGKDTVAEYLASKGYAHISSGEVIRDDMKKLGLDTDRGSIHQYVIQKRQEVGNSYPSQEIIDDIKNKAGILSSIDLSMGIVVSGFRNTEEVSLFRKEISEFKLIAVDAPMENRYTWAKTRGRIGDDITFERFKKEEEQEKAKITGSYQVDAAIGMADILIVNNGTKDDLFNKVNAFLVK
jgi:dephospho-CoA kinase